MTKTNTSSWGGVIYDKGPKNPSQNLTVEQTHLRFIPCQMETETARPSYREGLVSCNSPLQMKPTSKDKRHLRKDTCMMLRMR